MKKLLYLLALLSFNAQAQVPAWEHIWTEGDGTVAIPAADIPHYGETAAHVEILWTPRIIYTTGTSQRLIDIPGHFGVWIWNDGIHGAWYNSTGEERLFRTRYGLVSPGVEVKIVITWNYDGYAVIIDDVVRIHDWQTEPTTVYPDPDVVNGVYGSLTDGGSVASGSFSVKFYDAPVAYDACSVDVVGTINEGVDNVTPWSQGIDPLCLPDPDPDPDPLPDPDPPIDPALTEVELSWTNATQNDDGSLIPATGEGALVDVKLYWGACLPNDMPAEPLSQATVPVSVPGAARNYIVEIGTPGRWCFYATHTNNLGQTSVFSDIAIKEILTTPVPPVNLTVQDVTVFYVVQQPNSFILLAVGTVPPDTECIPSQTVNGYYAVPQDQVTWTGTVRPLVVVADCS